MEKEKKKKKNHSPVAQQYGSQYAHLSGVVLCYKKQIKGWLL
jgi:hypothetical protein